jgi:hypothetical protein
MNRVLRRFCRGGLLCAGLLNGCSLITSAFPHPNPARPDRGIEQCPLEVSQSRKQLPSMIQAHGVPNPLIIRDRSLSAGNRLVKTGQSIYFFATRHDADPPRNYAPDMNRHVISMEPAVPIPDSSVWLIGGLDENGKLLPDGYTLSDKSLIRLRNSVGAGYLEIVNDLQSITDVVVLRGL